MRVLGVKTQPTRSPTRAVRQSLQLVAAEITLPMSGTRWDNDNCTDPCHCHFRNLQRQIFSLKPITLAIFLLYLKPPLYILHLYWMLQEGYNSSLSLHLPTGVYGGAVARDRRAPPPVRCPGVRPILAPVGGGPAGLCPLCGAGESRPLNFETSPWNWGMLSYGLWTFTSNKNLTNVTVYTWLSRKVT